MNQKLKSIFMQKANKTIAIILSFAVLLTMIPTFALPVFAAEGDFTAAQATSSGNYVTLNWSGVSGSKFAITKSNGGQDVYETIPLKYTVKVLNVYPDAGNNLKSWMEANNMGSPNINGTQYTMSVGAISITNFNSSPSTYLGTPGNWNYDVVYFGAYDSNNNKDINTTARDLVEKFINASGGVLLGHDTAAGLLPNFTYLAETYLALKASTSSDTASSSYIPTYGNSQVKVARKGLLTNYPYSLGDVGTVMHTPESHSYHEFASGNVWFTYNGTDSSWDPEKPELTSYNSVSGTNNFYLTTRNNIAMIQTGHSNGAATTDEQKILTNTLYYLAQTTNAASFDDHSAQDLTAPSPVSGAASVSGNMVTFPASTDTGNTYDYKLYTVNDIACTKTDTGKVATATVTSGMKGYAVAVDQNSSQIGLGTTVNATSPSCDFGTKPAGNYYLHVRAVDNAGNASSESVIPFTIPITTSNVSSSAAVGSSISATSNANGTLYLVAKPAGDYTTKAQLDAAVSVGGTSAASTANTATSISTSGLNTGDYQLYAADFNGNISAPVAVTLTKATPALTTPTVNPASGQSYPVGDITFSVTLNGYYGTRSGQAITFWNGSTQIGSGTTDSNGKASYTWSNPDASSYSITAQFATDSNNSSATSAALTYGINKGTQTALTITDPGSKTYGDSSFKLSISGGSGAGNVSYTSVDNSILTVDSSGNVTIVGAGQGKITVTKSGDSNYNGPISKDISITVATKSLTVTPTSNQSKLFGTADPSSLSYTYSGNISGETPAFTGTLSRNIGESIGNYGITHGDLTLTNGTGGFLASNYSLDFSSTIVNFTVTAYHPTERATLTSPNGDSGWFKDGGSDITLTAPAGFTITTTNDWASFITVDKADGSDKIVNYYLKRTSDGAISTVLTSSSYKVDTTAPVVQPVSYGTDNFKAFLNTITFGLFFKDTVTATLTATDTGSGVKEFKYTVGGTAYTVAATGGSATFTIPPQYKGNISGVKAIDHASNVSAENATEYFAVDHQNPAAPTVDTNGYISGTWTKENVKITVSDANADSGIAKYQYSKGSDPTWYDMTTTEKSDATDSEPYNAVKAELTIGADCSGVSYKFRAVSNAGNNGTASDTTVVNINSVLPVVSSIGGNPSGWTNADVTLSVWATDSTGGLAAEPYSFDDGATWQASDSQTFSSNQTVNVRIKDKAGNISTATAVAITTIDKTVPVISLIDGNPSSWTSNNVTLSVTATDAASGLAAEAYSFDGGASWQTSQAKTFSSNQTVSILVKDTAGNISAPTNIAITTIDKTLPVISSVGGNPSSWTNSDVTLSVTATDAASGLAAEAYSFDGGSSWQTSNTKTFSSNQVVSICVKDSTGNISTPTNVAITKIDQTAPIVQPVSYGTDNFKAFLNTLTFGLLFKDTVTVTLTATDAGSGVKEFKYTVDGTAYTVAAKGGSATFTIPPQYKGNISNVKAIDNAGNESAENATEYFAVDHHNPNVPTVETNGYVPGTWTNNDVRLTVSGASVTSGIAKYQYSTDNGATWSDMTATGKTDATATDPLNVTKAELTINGNMNGSVLVRAVSNAGFAGDSKSVPVKFYSDALKEVIKDIDNLPDPGSAPDKEITDNEQAIKDTKILFDTLSKDEQSAVGQPRIDKLNQLISRLNALLVIIPKDTDTGITAGNIGTSVQLPELNDPSVGKVVVKLAVAPATSSGTQHANIGIASTSLGQSGSNLVAAFDVSLIKSVFDAAGNQTSTGKVSNANITGPITIMIPVPAGYQGRTDLQVVYIDDSGNVTPLTTTLVTVDGIQYLQFTTTHFSVYAVTAQDKTSSVPNPKTGNQTSPAPLFEFALLCVSAAIILRGRKNHKDKTSR